MTLNGQSSSNRCILTLSNSKDLYESNSLNSTLAEILGLYCSLQTQATLQFSAHSDHEKILVDEVFFSCRSFTSSPSSPLERERNNTAQKPPTH